MSDRERERARELCFISILLWYVFFVQHSNGWVQKYGTWYILILYIVCIYTVHRKCLHIGWICVCVNNYSADFIFICFEKKKKRKEYCVVVTFGWCMCGLLCVYHDGFEMGKGKYFSYKNVLFFNFLENGKKYANNVPCGVHHDQF